MIKGRNTTEACILREDCLSQDSYRKIKVTIGLSTKREQASNEEIDDFWILCGEKKMIYTVYNQPKEMKK